MSRVKVEDMGIQMEFKRYSSLRGTKKYAVTIRRMNEGSHRCEGVFPIGLELQDNVDHEYIVEEVEDVMSQLMRVDKEEGYYLEHQSYCEVVDGFLTNEIGVMPTSDGVNATEQAVK